LTVLQLLLLPLLLLLLLLLQDGQTSDLGVEPRNESHAFPHNPRKGRVLVGYTWQKCGEAVHEPHIKLRVRAGSNTTPRTGPTCTRGTCVSSVRDFKVRGEVPLKPPLAHIRRRKRALLGSRGVAVYPVGL
jgi:hypothetical protein